LKLQETYIRILEQLHTHQEGQVTFWMGQVTLTSSLVPDKWLGKEEFGEHWHSIENSWTKVS